MFASVETKEILLKRKSYYMEKHVERYAWLQHAGFLEQRAMHCDDIILRMTAYIWGDDEPARTFEHSYPATWWQWFKQRWFPRWLIARYPVKLHTWSVDVECVYPSFVPSKPDTNYRLVVAYPKNFNPCEFDEGEGD